MDTDWIQLFDMGRRHGDNPVALCAWLRSRSSVLWDFHPDDAPKVNIREKIQMDNQGLQKQRRRRGMSETAAHAKRDAPSRAKRITITNISATPGDGPTVAPMNHSPKGPPKE